MRKHIHLPRPVLTTPVGERDHIQGPTDAPIKLVEYGDFECPFCGQAYPLVQAIQQELGNRLCFAFRHFPLANAHPHAEHAAEAAEAAGAQGSFWGMHDILFENQTALGDRYLAQYAAALGLDADLVVEEVTAGKYSQRIREDFSAGVRSGVNGTPTFFINGVRYDGEQTLDVMLPALVHSEGIAP